MLRKQGDRGGSVGAEGVSMVVQGLQDATNEALGSSYACLEELGLIAAEGLTIDLGLECFREPQTCLRTVAPAIFRPRMTKKPRAKE